MKLAVPCLLVIVGCSPVLLGEEQGLPSAGASASGATGGQGSASGGAAAAGDLSMPDASLQKPSVIVRITAPECGPCFGLLAQGLGGVPPYAFEWSDGSTEAERELCVEPTAASVSVVAIDTLDSRSEPQNIQLEQDGDAGCPDPSAQLDASAPVERLCLVNPSLEGTPAISFGDPAVFDADPWSLCSNVTDPPNAPDIGNQSISMSQMAPMPTHGDTYLALGEGEQVSQEPCSPITGDAPLYFELDAASIAIGELVPNSEQIFLEVWGGLAVDCSQRELLWASRALTADWQRLCVTLRPRSHTTQLTLRGSSDMASNSLGHVLIDNLRPVDSCP